MAVSKKMVAAFNDQINAELYSSYLYLSMSAWFETQDLSGFARWMQAQAKEENTHAMKLYAHVLQRGGAVKLAAIEAPPAKWKDPLDAFQAVAKHERHVTDLITKLADLADAESDRPAANLLQWFINEQVEEEASADAIVAKLQKVGDAACGILQMDQALGQRGS